MVLRNELRRWLANSGPNASQNEARYHVQQDRSMPPLHSRCLLDLALASQYRIYSKSSSELASDLLTNAVIMHGAVRSFVYQFSGLDIELILYSESITLLTPTWMVLHRIQHSLRP